MNACYLGFVSKMNTHFSVDALETNFPSVSTPKNVTKDFSTSILNGAAMEASKVMFCLFKNALNYYMSSNFSISAGPAEAFSSICFSYNSYCFWNFVSAGSTGGGAYISITKMASVFSKYLSQRPLSSITLSCLK